MGFHPEGFGQLPKRARLGAPSLIFQFVDVVECHAAGGYAVEVEDFDFAYALYSGATRVATFREGRIGYRLWAMRTERISPSLEDRYDHDVDELMA